MDYEKLIFNTREAFSRVTLEKRMQQYGFKNIERMEKFLWDLELFLQIQNILRENIVLKGGAATQFYLPIYAQRTSIDIDMMYNGKFEEIDKVLEKIKNIFENNEGLFEFKIHKPKNPKTSLPLYTYFVNVPSELETKDLYNKNDEQVPFQELKVEFIIQNSKLTYHKKKGNNLFAVNSELEYQVLPINHLFADKLTTLGPNTIGVQDVRLDEQVKQFYDILMLTRYNFKDFNIKLIKDLYLNRAKQESESRDINYDIDVIKNDVIKQLERYSLVDSGEDPVLKNTINDFKSLYLNAKVEYNQQIVSCGAKLIMLMYETIIDGDSWNIVEAALYIENRLELNEYSGKAKGLKAKELREMLIYKFAAYSDLSPNVLKGKRLNRIFWSVINKDNVFEIKDLIEKSVEEQCALSDA